MKNIFGLSISALLFIFLGPSKAVAVGWYRSPCEQAEDLESQQRRLVGNCFLESEKISAPNVNSIQHDCDKPIQSWIQAHMALSRCRAQTPLTKAFTSP